MKAEFPDSVSIAASNQEVINKSDCVILALPGSVASAVLQPLNFSSGQQVVSVIAALRMSDLQFLLGDVDVSRALPMPAIAKRHGATVGFPDRPFAQALFAPMGSYVPVADEEILLRMGAVGSLMGDFYKRQLTIQQWLTEHGTDPDDAAAYIGAMYDSFAFDSAAAGVDTFSQLLASQTPGGTNEMVWKQFDAEGVYTNLNKSLDAVYNRSTAPHLSGEVFLV